MAVCHHPVRLHPAERFDLSYIGPDGEKHRPIMLHRVILGAIERFVGVLIEQYVGAFPLWLSPVQAILLTVTEKTDFLWGRGVQDPPGRRYPCGEGFSQ